MSSIAQLLFQHRPNCVVGGVSPQDELWVRIHEVQTNCGPQRLFHPLEFSIQTTAFSDPFLVSSRLPLSMAVMGAAYSAYILLYPEY